MRQHAYALAQTIAASVVLAFMVWFALILLTAMARP